MKKYIFVEFLTGDLFTIVTDGDCQSAEDQVMTEFGPLNYLRIVSITKE